MKLPHNRVLSLAIPATIENLLQTLVGFLDTFMIAKVGLVAVTAVGIANTILNVYLAVFIALGVGTSALIAQYLGAGQKDAAREISNQSMTLAIIFGVLFGILSVTAGQLLLQSMGAADEVLLVASQFFYVVGGAAVFMALMTVLGSILRASGDTKSPMKITFIVNVINVVVDYLLIFGIGPFPALGVLGTALGTVISRILGCYFLWLKVQQSKSPLDRRVFSKSNFRPLIKLSVPATLERLVMRMGQVVYFGLIVGIGANIFAAHSIAGTIESFTYMPGYGLATAATTLVGHSYGAKDKEAVKRFALTAVSYGVLIMSLLAAVLYIGAPYFASLFTSDKSVIQQIVIALRIDAFAQPALAVSLILTGVLQGMGDTSSPLFSTAFGMWGIRIIGVLLLSKQFQMGIAGIWLSIAADLYLRSFFLYYRYRKRYNKTKSQV